MPKKKFSFVTYGLIIYFIIGLILFITIPKINNFIVQNDSIWSFLQGLGTIVAVVALVISLIDNKVKSNQEEVRFKLETDAYIIPISIQDYIKSEEKNILVHNFKLDKINYSANLKDKWETDVWDISGINHSIVDGTVYPYLAIKNQGKVNAKWIKIEICSKKNPDNDLTSVLTKYEFMPENTVVEEFNSLEVEKSIILCAEDKHYFVENSDQPKVDFTRSFGIRITYYSDHLGLKQENINKKIDKEELTLVFEAKVISRGSVENSDKLLSYIHMIPREYNI